MEESLISFKVAKLAKEKGFDWGCADCFNERGKLYSNGWCEILDTFFRDEDFFNSEIESEQILEKYYTVSTQSLLQKWLRNEHKLHVESRKSNGKGYFFRIKEYPINKIHPDSRYKSYEEALEAGLYEALKLIK